VLRRRLVFVLTEGGVDVVPMTPCLSADDVEPTKVWVIEMRQRLPHLLLEQL
jgi:hypothetical protein